MIRYNNVEVMYMEIIKVTPRGFCKGVVGAIQIAKKARMEFPTEKITILGMLVHNRFVVQALKELNIETIEKKGKTRLELLDEVNEGIVIFTAHGVSLATYEKALAKGLKIIDATCPDVTKTQKMILAYLSNGYDVIYIGKKGHPESEACVTLSSNVHLIENIEDLDTLELSSKIFLTNQTTMSMMDVATIIEKAKDKFPHIEICEEICDATRMRQQAIAQLQNIDLLYIVGDPNSNNSNKLAEIGLLHGVTKSRLIESIEDIQDEDLIGCQRIAVSSGASTPTYLTNQVIEYLEAFAENQQAKKEHVNIHKIL